MGKAKAKSPSAPKAVPLSGVQPHDLLRGTDAAAFAGLVQAIDAGLREHGAGHPGNFGVYRCPVAELIKDGFGPHDLIAAVASRYIGWDVSWGLDPPPQLVFRVRELKR